MFDKMFEAIARKQLEENAIDKFFREMNNRHLEKIGAIVEFPNGTKGYDIVKAHAIGLKRNVLLTAVCIGAGIIGNKLGGMNS